MSGDTLNRRIKRKTQTEEWAKAKGWQPITEPYRLPFEIELLRKAMNSLDQYHADYCLCPSNGVHFQAKTQFRIWRLRNW